MDLKWSGGCLGVAWCCGLHTTMQPPQAKITICKIYSSQYKSGNKKIKKSGSHVAFVLVALVTLVALVASQVISHLENVESHVTIVLLLLSH
jgi:hypothetical protein